MNTKLIGIMDILIGLCDLLVAALDIATGQYIGRNYDHTWP